MYIAHACCLVLCDVNSFHTCIGGETWQYKAVRPREHLEAYLITAGLGDLCLLKSNGVCDSLRNLEASRFSDDKASPHTQLPLGATFLMDPPHSAEIISIPTHSSASTTLHCCCGRKDCALLEHNNIALEGLEKDLETAARLGQVRVL
jgi:hypothetical protein